MTCNLQSAIRNLQSDQSTICNLNNPQSRQIRNKNGLIAAKRQGFYGYLSGDQRKFFRYALASAKEAELWLWRAKQRQLMMLLKNSTLKLTKAKA